MTAPDTYTGYPRLTCLIALLVTASFGSLRAQQTPPPGKLAQPTDSAESRILQDLTAPSATEKGLQEKPEDEQEPTREQIRALLMRWRDKIRPELPDDECRKIDEFAAQVPVDLAKDQWPIALMQRDGKEGFGFAIRRRDWAYAARGFENTFIGGTVQGQKWRIKLGFWCYLQAALIHMGPNHLCNVGFHLNNLGAYNDATLVLRYAKSLSIHLPAIHNNLAHAQASQGNTEKAVLSALTALTLASDSDQYNTSLNAYIAKLDCRTSEEEMAQRAEEAAAMMKFGTERYTTKEALAQGVKKSALMHMEQRYTSEEEMARDIAEVATLINLDPARFEKIIAGSVAEATELMIHDPERYKEVSVQRLAEAAVMTNLDPERYPTVSKHQHGASGPIVWHLAAKNQAHEQYTSKCQAEEYRYAKRAEEIQRAWDACIKSIPEELRQYQENRCPCDYASAYDTWENVKLHCATMDELNQEYLEKQYEIFEAFTQRGIEFLRNLDKILCEGRKAHIQGFQQYYLSEKTWLETRVTSYEKSRISHLKRVQTAHNGLLSTMKECYGKSQPAPALKPPPQKKSKPEDIKQVLNIWFLFGSLEASTDGNVVLKLSPKVVPINPIFEYNFETGEYGSGIEIGLSLPKFLKGVKAIGPAGKALDKYVSSSFKLNLMVHSERGITVGSKFDAKPKAGAWVSPPKYPVQMKYESPLMTFQHTNPDP